MPAGHLPNLATHRDQLQTYHAVGGFGKDHLGRRVYHLRRCHSLPVSAFGPHHQGLSRTCLEDHNVPVTRAYQENPGPILRSLTSKRNSLKRHDHSEGIAVSPQVILEGPVSRIPFTSICHCWKQLRSDGEGMTEWRSERVEVWREKKTRANVREKERKWDKMECVLHWCRNWSGVRADIKGDRHLSRSAVISSYFLEILIT